jgi:hypothetical protein
LCLFVVVHYSTTCPLNRDVAARGRGGHRGRRGTMGTKKGDHQFTDKLEFMEAASEEDTDEEIYEMEN